MPDVFLNPSTPSTTQHLDGGDEQVYMNQIVDAMEPYLRTNGIRYFRTKPGTPLGQAIRESNAGYYDMHLALRSSPSPQDLTDKPMGTNIFYYTYGARSKRAAEIVAENYKRIYPDPVLVKAVPTNRVAEVTKTNAPAVLVETIYSDSTSGEEWLKNNIKTIAMNLTESLTRCFAIPFINKPHVVFRGTVATKGGNLNIRMQPDTNSQVVAQAPNGAPVEILGLWQEWYVLDYKGNVGYAGARHITL